MSDAEKLAAQAHLPSIQLDRGRVEAVKKDLDITDRANIVTYGDNAQRRVSDFADRILAETRNKEMGKTGDLLTDILTKAKGLDPASVGKLNWFQRLFTNMQARLSRFKEQFSTVASQIDRVTIELDKHKEGLRRDIHMLDDLHEQTKAAIAELTPISSRQGLWRGIQNRSPRGAEGRCGCEGQHDGRADGRAGLSGCAAGAGSA